MSLTYALTKQDEVKMATAVQTYGLYIDGQWHAAREGKTFEVRNPATSEVIADVADGGVYETRRAIAAAHAAFPAWSATTADKRAALLLKAAQLMIARVDQLAEVLTKENGKPLAEAKGEVSI